MRSIIQYTAADENGQRTFSAVICKGDAVAEIGDCTQVAAAKLKNDLKSLPNAKTTTFRCLADGQRASLDAVICGITDENAIDLASAFAAAVKDKMGVDVEILPMRKH